MADYTYMAHDLVTGDVIDEVALAVSGLTWSLMEPGTMAGPSVPLYDRQRVPDPAAMIGATIPGRTALYAYRDERLIWGGIIWKRNYRKSSGRLELVVTDFLSYWRRRLITVTTRYDQQDQFAIATDLFNDTLTGLGVVEIVLPGGTTGVLRDRSYEGSEFKPVLEAVTELAAVDGGFEFAVDVRADVDGIPERVLRLGYPMIGATDSVTIEEPGNVQDYQWPEDGDEMCTDMWTRSESTEGATLIGHYQDGDLLANGWPRLERANTSYSEVRIQATIDGHAKADQEAAAGPVVAATFTVIADDEEAQIGSWNVGDWARVRVSDDRFPADPVTGAPGMDDSLRTVAASLDPNSDMLDITVNPILVSA